jgi:adenylate cyclase
MPDEIELKLAVRPADAPRLLRHPLLAKAERLPARSLFNIYYDTPELALRNRGVALRQRRQGGRWLQTVKCAGETAGGLSARPEWEYPAARGRFDFGGIDDAALRAWLASDDILPRLRPVFETRFRRDARLVAAANGATVEVALDRGSITAGERQVPICELEMELDGGGVGVLFELAAQVAADMPLRPEPQSKADRGYRLGGAQAIETASALAPLQADLSPREAFRAAAAAALDRFLRHEELARQDAGNDELHRAGLALRRLRSALRLFKPFVPDKGARELRRHLKRLARRLDRTRQWGDLIDICRQAAPDESIDALCRALDARRGESHARLAAMLDAPGHGRGMIELLALLHLPAGAAATEVAAPEFVEFAAGRLDRAAKRLRSSVGRYGRGKVAATARVIAAIGRLEDALWLFGALFDRERIEDQCRRLAEAAADLAFVHALDCAGPLLAEAAGEDPQLAGALPVIAAAHMPRYRSLRATLVTRLGGLVGQRQGWKPAQCEEPKDAED